MVLCKRDRGKGIEKNLTFPSTTAIRIREKKSLRDQFIYTCRRSVTRQDRILQFHEDKYRSRDVYGLYSAVLCVFLNGKTIIIDLTVETRRWKKNIICPPAR